MSFLREIQKIYNEGGYQGQSMYTPQRVVGAQTPRQDKNSLAYPLPTTSPDQPAYVTSPMGVAPVEAEEGVVGEIRKDKVLEMINKEMEDASSKGMDYCMFVLGKLKEAIKQTKH